MKKNLKFILAVCAAAVLMLCGSMSAFALTEGDWEFQLLDNQVTITGYSGSDTDIVIPDTIYGCPVTVVNGRIFNAATTESVTFPKTVKEIGRVINAHEYSDVWTLKEVNIPEGVEVIGRNAFSYCKGIEEIKLPSTIKEIGFESFYRSENLSEINLPDGLQTISTDAFSGCSVSSFIVPASVTEIRGGAFANNPKLETLIVNAPITGAHGGHYGGFASGCPSLKTLELPNTLKSIGNGAFSGNPALESIILPASLNDIANGAFSGCTSLKEVVIPYGVTSLGAAFENCTSLKALYVPDSIVWMSPYVISGCNNCIVYCTQDSKPAATCKENSISYLTDSSVNTEINVLYNGTRISFHQYGQNPALLSNRTLVPLRSIFEAMGAGVEWDASTSTAIAKRNGVEVKIQIGANTMYKNGAAVGIDVPAQLLNDRTMVPVRVIAEAFGADVEWHGAGKTVLINE